WNDRLDYDLVLYLARTIIFNDPVKNCRLKGSLADWNGLPPNRSLFNSAEGCGLPIGNLTSQMFSNIYLTPFDNYVKRDLKFKHYGRYVDDFYLVHQDKEVLVDAVPKIAAYLRDELKLTLHPKKIYLQKYEHGILYTGAYVKPHRIYAGNRVKANMSKRLEELKSGERVNPSGLRCTVNSYLGIMKHYKTFDLRRKIMMNNAWVFKFGCVRHCCSYFKLNKSAGKNIPPEEGDSPAR
ncbi:MAG: RNA-directed DNA polymerase, partial [Prevotella sp.]|nr:RNA-directed DNA polymerase [Prevotella sp.]